MVLADGDRVLVKDQADPKSNGIYGASTGNWQRSRDFDGARAATPLWRSAFTWRQSLVVECGAGNGGTIEALYHASNTDAAVHVSSRWTLVNDTFPILGLRLFWADGTSTFNAGGRARVYGLVVL